MMTWAALDYGGVETVGLCHGVQNGHRQIAARPRRADDRRRHRLLGHQPPDLVPRHQREGRNVTARRAPRRLRAPPGLLAPGEGAHRRAEALRLLLDRVERAPLRVPALVPQAARRDHELDRPLRLDPRRDRRLPALLAPRTATGSRTDFPKFLEEAGKPLAEHERTDEHASHILEALETGRTYRGHFNVRNGGDDHQPARGLHHREPGLRRPLRHQHGRGRHPAARLRRHLLGQRQRAADGGAGRDDRRRRRS